MSIFSQKLFESEILNIYIFPLSCLLPIQNASPSKNPYICLLIPFYTTLSIFFLSDYQYNTLFYLYYNHRIKNIKKYGRLRPY